MAKDTDATPLRKQYLDIKHQYPDTILFFRLGDFYETFDEDAALVARELELVLTHRMDRPMAGVPFHAVENYIAKLIGKGYHVAICEQTGPAAIKGLFKREVVRVVTPGTVTEPSLVPANRNNYLAALAVGASGAGLAFVDITTGEFATTLLQGHDVLATIRHELTRLHPAELLLADNSPLALESLTIPRTPLPAWKFDSAQARNTLLEHFKVSTLTGFGIDQSPLAIAACGAIVQYLKDTQPGALNLLTRLSTYSLDEFMTLDTATRRNLELTETLRTGQVKGSLLAVLDKTITPMGARLLRQWVNQPLLDVARITERQDGVAALHTVGVLRAELRSALKPLADVERITNRILGGTANPRDLVALRATLVTVPEIQAKLEIKNWTPAGQVSPADLRPLTSDIDTCADTLELLQSALADEPPAVMGKPGIMRSGYSAELDGILSASQHAREWIASLEKVERERTGLKTLRVSYNKVFGYYIEISRGKSDNPPENYIRKQTLVNAERFITPELKEYETLVLNADERILEIETRLFKELCAQIGVQAGRLLATARALARLDVLAALAEVAAQNNLVRPEVLPDNGLDIVGGRHPVVEHFLPAGQRFVPNDCVFEPDESVRVITGPNAGGKCVRGDTLVFTNTGLTPIESLRPNTMTDDTFAPVRYTVKGREGHARATHFYQGGQRSTIRIRTRFGYELEGTPEHRIWVRCSSGEEGWKPLREIERGDVVAIDRQIDLWGGRNDLHLPGVLNLRPRTNLKIYPMPTQLTPDLAYVIGLLVGDGTLREKNQLALTTGDEFIAQEFCRIIQAQFGYRPRPLAKSKHFDYRISSRQIRLFFEELGLGYVTALKKSIPQPILNASKPVVVGFLQGLFDTDGYADKRGRVSLSTSSSLLARQVQALLLNFGIVSSLQQKKGVPSTNLSYQVYIHETEVSAFYRDIGFRLPRKQARAKPIVARPSPNLGIPHLAPLLKQIQARIVAAPNKATTLKSNKSVNSIFYTYLPNGRNISYFKLDDLIEYCQLNNIACPELQIIIRQRYFYDTIAQTTLGESAVFDLSVEQSHAFVANGFVNHNSTYLRQSALIVLMAQMGSFVPAERARLGLVDRIFTRIGAQDEIHAGQSTFMVEMVETANILHHATARSLLVLDEIGRGTSTYDGLSLAWAIVEYIHNHPRLKAKTLFATHYHELTDLATLLPGVRNYSVSVKEEGDQVVFLHRIIPGGADRSYGIHVAQLAGLPRPVIARAQEIMGQLEASGGRAVHLDEQQSAQMALFPETNPLLDELKALDLTGVTPLEALSKLFEWQARFV